MPGELLRITNGSLAGTEIELRDELAIGRAEEGEGNLGGDPELSRQHARFRRGDDARIVVEDLESAHGGLVNRERITAARGLSPRDPPKLGTTTPQPRARPAGAPGRAAG